MSRFNSMRRLSIAILVAGFALSGCQAAPPASSREPTTTVGGSWAAVVRGPSGVTR